MGKLSFNDLISGPNLSTFEKEIEGLGVVEITEISGAECLQHISEAQALADSGTTEEDHHNHLIKWAGRLLKGSFMDEAESKALSASLGQSTIVKIYYAGLEANGKAEESKEDFEKN